jgi:hypothetical protein
MLMVVLVVVSAVASGAVIWIRNGKRRRYRERGWAMLILTIGTAMIIGLLLRVPLPNPLDAISAIYAPIYKPILAWIEEDESSS